MTCRDVVDFLMAYLAHELEPTEAAVFEEHLGHCPDCVVYLNTYRQAVEMGRCVCGQEEVPIPEDLVRAILAARPQPAKPSHP